MIIYFTGTGNSLSTARYLAELLDTKALYINEALNADPSQEKVIGLVYPCYYGDMPDVVKDFVRRFPFKRTAYIFGILTHGGDPGNSIYSFLELLKEIGMDLSYGDDILMPVNSRLMYGGVVTNIESRVKNQKKKVERIASNIKKRKNNASAIKKKVLVALMSNLAKSALAKRMANKRVDHEKCNNCGTCVKVCSSKNITIPEDKVTIGKNCTDCLACMHWCPKVAIGFGRRKVKKKQQYHHPDVTLKDIIIEQPVKSK